MEQRGLDFIGVKQPGSGGNAPIGLKLLSDLFFDTNSMGLVLTNRTDGTLWRLFIANDADGNPQLQMEQISLGGS